MLWNEDEWLMYEMSDQDKQFISELMEVRHDTCSTIFCSQYPTEDWYDKLHKSTLTEALLDRIVHNRIDIDMGTENFRIK
ncbi:MAG: ATP-binding protein [Catenibacterium sp.]|uniref:ATP-binding protein n=1 Tax=Catenibacterium sp. TaxID=2049022 RepID=UPI003995B127